MESTINHYQLKIKKISNTKNIKFRDANGNEIKELNYLVEYSDDSIEKYIEGKNFSVQTKSTKDGMSIYKNYKFTDYIDLWSLAKKIFKGKLSIKEARKQQNAMGKRLQSCIIGLITVVLEKE